MEKISLKVFPSNKERNAFYYAWLLIQHGASKESAILDASIRFKMPKGRMVDVFDLLVEPLPKTSHTAFITVQANEYSRTVLSKELTDKFCDIVNKHYDVGDQLGLFAMADTNIHTLHLNSVESRVIGFIGNEIGEIVYINRHGRRYSLGNIYILEGDYSLYQAAYKMGGILNGRCTKDYEGDNE
jgi:hypothetical protein